MSEIRPIQTYYDGHWFRSRLEARWAVVFNALGVPYEYEPEGFDLGNGLCYLPDFRVKCYGKRGDYESEPFDLYIEVKGKMTEQDAEKIRRFSGMEIVTRYKCLEIAEFDPPECFSLRGSDLNPYLGCPDDYRSCEYLLHDESIHIKNPVLIVNKIPGEGQETDSAMCTVMGFDLSPFNYETIDGDWFGAYPAATADGHFYLFGDDSNYINECDAQRIAKAYRIARCARFEHGERPPV